MTVTVVVPPAPIITLDEAKAHLRVEGTEDDDYITGLIAAATAWIDGPGGWLGRALGEQTLELRTRCFSRSVLDLPYPPIISVESVKYLDSSGVEQTIDPALYEVGLSGVTAAYGTSWPTARSVEEAVRVRYVAGYADGVPASIRHALLMLVAEFYARREATSADKPERLPFGVEALLAPHKIWRV